MLMLIALSGFPIISENDDFYLIIGLFLSVMFSFNILRAKLNYTFFIVFILISFLQIITIDEDRKSVV